MNNDQALVYIQECGSTTSFMKYTHYYICCCQNLCLTLICKISPITGPRSPEGSRKLRFPDYVTMAQDGGKVVSLTHRPLLQTGNTSGTHFCYSLSRPKGHSTVGRILRQWKFPLTTSWIEPATFRFVAQHLNHCATAVPHKRLIYIYIYISKSVPLQAWSGPEGSRKLRFPDYMTTAQDGCQPYAPAAFTPRKCCWYSFLLEAESIPGP